VADSKRDNIKKLAAGGGLLILGSFTSKAIMYFYRLVTANKLGSAEYGLLNLGLAVFWISLTFTQLGLKGGLNRKVSHYFGKDEKEKVFSVIWSSLKISLPWSIIYSVILFLSAEILAVKVFNKPGMTTIIQVMAIAIPFQTLYSQLESVSEAMKDVKYIAFVDKVFRSLFITLTTIAVLYAGFGLTSTIYIQAIGAIISGLLMAVLVQRKVIPVFSNITRMEKRETTDLVTYSYPLLFSGIMGMVMTWTDTLLLGVMRSASTVGVYNAAYPTAQMLTVIAGGFGSLLFPVVSEHYSKGEKKEAIEISSTAIKWIFTSSFPLLLVMVVFARPLLRLLFGTDYTSGATAMAILGSAYFLQSLGNHGSIFIKSEDRTKIVFYNSVIAAALNIILNVLLIPIYGQTGAALATAFSGTLVTVIAVIEAYRFFDVQPYRLKKLLPPALAGIISASAVYFTIKSMYKTTPELALIPAGIAFGGLYVVLYIALGGLDKEDLIILSQAEQKIPLELERAKKVVKKLADHSP
jgi:O-antigen/teichoic acid export membrane protein